MTILVSDVGGTNVRFAIAAGVDQPLEFVHSMACADFPTIEAAVAAYLAGLDADHPKNIEAVVIAVAGPVNADVVDVTNNHWRFDKRQLRSTLAVERLLVINDFTAQALAQSDPTANGNVEVLSGTPNSLAPLLVIGPGTGLGVSGLIRSNGTLIPIEGEGGHVAFSPRSAREMALYEFHHKTHQHIVAEHFVSGPGLETIYRFLVQDMAGPAKMTAPEIGAKALAEDGVCREAAMIMLGCLGTVILNNVLTLGCWGGAVIAGGIVPRLAPLIGQSALAARIRNGGGDPGLTADLPVWLSTDPHAGLRGACAALGNDHLASRCLTG